MKKTTIAVLVILGLGMLACTTDAPSKHGHSKHKHGHHKGGLQKLVMQLDLTDAQKTQFKALRATKKTRMMAKRKEYRAKNKHMKHSKRGDMSKFMSANYFDKAAFKAQMNKRFERKSQKMKKAKEARLERKAEDMQKVFNILTAEQRLKLIELSKK